jgi:hypothetical protein
VDEAVDVVSDRANNTQKGGTMNLDSFSDDEVVLMARALSIHRASLRRKVDRVTDAHERALTITEMKSAQRIINKLNSADLRRISVA